MTAMAAVIMHGTFVPCKTWSQYCQDQDIDSSMSRAEIKLGEMLLVTAENKTRETRGGDRKSKSPNVTLKPTLEELGITKREASQSVINETVMTAREYLNAELKKYETLKELKSTDKSISSLFKDEHGFRRAKAGVGRETIKKVLGGNWKQWQLQYPTAPVRGSGAAQERFFGI
jgi:hypothetical protein